MAAFAQIGTEISQLRITNQACQSANRKKPGLAAELFNWLDLDGVIARQPG
jgi:hypothetical protein